MKSGDDILRRQLGFFPPLQILEEMFSSGKLREAVENCCPAKSIKVAERFQGTHNLLITWLRVIMGKIISVCEFANFLAF